MASLLLMAANHHANHPLRRWRLEKNLSLREAGALLDISDSALGKYERGKRFPRPHQLAAIVRVTGGAVSAGDFLPPAPPPVPADPQEQAA